LLRKRIEKGKACLEAPAPGGKEKARKKCPSLSQPFTR
jgi:hypothetical protein